MSKLIHLVWPLILLVILLLPDFGVSKLNKIGLLSFAMSKIDSGSNQTCPQEMAKVEGDYCFNLQHTCIKWMDPPKSIIRRCAEYEHKSVCKSTTEHLKFCMDIEEFVSPVSDDNIPLGDVTWIGAKEVCEQNGKRLCTDHEWTLACEGNERYPYPYGYRRESSLCNIDKMDILDDRGNMLDLRESINSNLACKSPFGIHNMTGNVDEWVMNPKEKWPNRSLLKGGWWGPLRNRCRVATGGHDEYFHEVQTGFRCCKNT